MKDFQPIAPEALENAFKLIGKDWMLITAAGKDESGRERVNTMTASWGHFGSLWGHGGGLPTSIIFVRPQRYTKEFVDREPLYSLCWTYLKYWIPCAP